MKKIILTILLISSMSYSAFYDTGIGARPIGLGGAFVGVADDANAMYYNIAGISQIKEITFTATYSNYFLGIKDNYMAVVCPFQKYGTIGVSWLNMAANLYNENTFTLGYSYPLDRNSYLGIGVKMLLKSFGNDELSALNPVFSKTTASGFAVDISLYSKLTDDISVGASFENLNQPDVSLSSKDTVPSIYRAGAKYKLFKSLFLTAEGDYRNSEIKGAIGSEYSVDVKFLETLGIKDSNISFRGGFGYGTNNYSNLSLGFSFFLPTKYVDGRLDYSFTLPFNFIDGMTTHRFTINIMEPKPEFNI
ncbi:MAG: hypothetical protein ABH873_09645 [Candidatus Firestonebacteria bacterium]